MPYDFKAIEPKWQRHWLENKTFAALAPQDAPNMPKLYVLDMFPYPSGSGLHVGHPEGYTATDIVSRYRRMQGYNVLHPMGWDAFGLPAEQHAIKTGQHPRVTTEAAIATFRRQIRMLGLSYDWDREIDTTDPGYYRWTQWIFLQLFNSYFDPILNKAMPIAHLQRELVNETYVIAPDGSIQPNRVSGGMQAIAGVVRLERLWAELKPQQQREVLDNARLAYMDEAAVNWCPALGTVLANEEVIDGKSEVGGFPVERRPMRQWMLRITAYAPRLLDDLATLSWPESLKEMQRNWIGRSTGAEVDFEVADAGADGPVITVFTTRPDTLFGATYMVLAPEHPLVGRLTSIAQREAVEAYQKSMAARSERDRLADAKEKSGVFIGGYAINPVNQQRIPVWIADYVLMGYGTGAIMAVPAHDERDFAFATKFSLPIVHVVQAPAPAKGVFSGDGIAINSPLIDGLPTAQAKQTITAWLEEQGLGHGNVKYKLRDWLFSRQRYWGEPFPILLDSHHHAYALDESALPVQLPAVEDFKPTGSPEGPLSKVTSWLQVAHDGRTLTRETNTMPQWAGSCWYYLRYIDPHNSDRFVDPELERYWMPVDLYVGGAEHAVLHLLYARFWHKVLFDLGHVSTAEPFNKLVNQGTILGEAEFTLFEMGYGQRVTATEVEITSDEGSLVVGIHKPTGLTVQGRRIKAEEVEKAGEGYRLKDQPTIRVDARSYKMSKSRGNVVNPDDIVAEYGADTFRLYEMYMGPLEQAKPWNTRDIVGMWRFLNSVWRNLIGDDDSPHAHVTEEPIPDDMVRLLHQTIKKVGEEIELLRFNTAIAHLITLNNKLAPPMPRALAETLVLLLAPFAPHMAEELWERLGHHKSLARRPWPVYDPAQLVESTIELPVQVNGKLRDKIVVPADATEESILAAAQSAPKVKPWIEGKTVRKRIYVAGKLVNLVAN